MSNLESPDTAVNTLRRVIAGDLRSIDGVYALDQKDLVRAAREIGRPLLLSREAVAGALRLLRDDAVDRDRARLWAEFVSFGSVGTAGEDAIEIEYQADSEDVLAEVLFRLREIDDPVSGELTSDDVLALLALVSAI